MAAAQGWRPRYCALCDRDVVTFCHDVGHCLAQRDQQGHTPVGLPLHGMALVVVLSLGLWGLLFLLARAIGIF